MDQILDQSMVEVTPAMEEAGFRVLSSSGIADDYCEAEKLLVARIYRAMFFAAPPATSSLHSDAGIDKNADIAQKESCIAR